MAHDLFSSSPRVGPLIASHHGRQDSLQGNSPSCWTQPSTSVRICEGYGQRSRKKLAPTPIYWCKLADRVMHQKHSEIAGCMTAIKMMIRQSQRAGKNQRRIKIIGKKTKRSCGETTMPRNAQQVNPSKFRFLGATSVDALENGQRKTGTYHADSLLAKHTQSMACAT